MPNDIMSPEDIQMLDEKFREIVGKRVCDYLDEYLLLVMSGDSKETEEQ